MSELKTVKAVEEAQQPEGDTITLSTGVVLRGKLVPQLTLVKIMAAFPRPKPPVWFNSTMGREMENPDSPDYVDQVKAWKTETANITMNAMILMGTELVSVPKKFPAPESKDWLEEYTAMGLQIFPENKSWRYLNWVTFKAAPVAADLELIKDVVGRLSGVSEAKVAAAEQFPGS